MYELLVFNQRNENKRMALPDLYSAVSAELFITHWQDSNRTFATRKN